MKPPPPPTKQIHHTPALPKGPKSPPTPNTPKRAVKHFRVEGWSGEGEGEKILAYSSSGMGKTTLAGMAPDPVFIGVDDGARKIRGRNGEVLVAIRGIEDYQDIRDAIRTPSLFKGKKTLVLDTITKTEAMAEPYLFENYKHEKGHKVRSIEGYGWGKGYKHLQDAMRLLLQDLDGLVKQGIHVLLLAQEAAVVVPNAGGLDFLQSGPKLYQGKSFSVKADYCEWADHVFRLDYINRKIEDKKASGDTERAVFITPEDASYCAK
ncbi:hypothetical protein LCGC14_2269260, partial [marine sediment metagenome]